jgi:hypothetical protein
MSTAANIIKKIATIANGATASDVVKLDRSLLCGLFFPTMTGTTVALSVSHDGATFFPIYDAAGGAVYATVTATDNSYVALSPDTTIGFQFLKITSASSEAAERQITVITKQVA